MTGTTKVAGTFLTLNNSWREFKKQADKAHVSDEEMRSEKIAYYAATVRLLEVLQMISNGTVTKKEGQRILATIGREVETFFNGLSR